MNARTHAPIHIVATGLVSAVGLSAPEGSAAARAGVTNPVRLDTLDSAGEALRGHRLPVEAEAPPPGVERLAFAAAMAIEECLAMLPAAERAAVPLLVCAAESTGPGRPDALDDTLLAAIEAALEHRFAPGSAVLAAGRIGAAIALAHAAKLLAAGHCRHVLVAGTDDLLDAASLDAYDAAGRLLTSCDSDGFMPGEAAAALLIAADEAAGCPCHGIGFGIEPAPLDSGEPLRAEGLGQALAMAFDEAGCTWDDIGMRIADGSGEQYHFKEAALALSRLPSTAATPPAALHPARFIGECGAASGVAALVFAVDAAARRVAGREAAGFVLAHLSDDGERRAALIFGAHVPGREGAAP